MLAGKREYNRGMALSAKWTKVVSCRTALLLGSSLTRSGSALTVRNVLSGILICGAVKRRVVWVNGRFVVCGGVRIGDEHETVNHFSISLMGGCVIWVPECLNSLTLG